MRRVKAFTLIELMVVISIIVMLIGILLPSLGAARNSARRMQGATQIRGIQQSTVTFAQSNNGNYPGLSGAGVSLTAAQCRYTGGALDGDSVEGRFGLMVEEGLVPPELLVAPMDTADKDVYVPGAVNAITGIPATLLDRGDYSYALLHITDQGQRRAEWSDTTNSSAIVASDRLVDRDGNVNSAANISLYDSIYAENGWEGNLVYNDNHVIFVKMGTTAATVGINTKYGTVSTTNDDPFGRVNANEAVLIGQGEAFTQASIENP